jgi:hypothetical protein
VIGHEGPGKAPGFRGNQKGGKSFKKMRTVLIVMDDIAAFDSADYDVL